MKSLISFAAVILVIGAASLLGIAAHEGGHALVGLAYLKANTDQIAWVWSIIVSVVAHPASTQEIKDRAERLRAKLQARLTPQEVAGLQAQAWNKPLEELMAEIVTTADR